MYLFRTTLVSLHEKLRPIRGNVHKNWNFVVHSHWIDVSKQIRYSPVVDPRDASPTDQIFFNFIVVYFPENLNHVWVKCPSRGQRTLLWEIMDPPLHTSINSFNWCPSQHCSYTILVDSFSFAFSNIPSDPSIASTLLYPLSFSWKFNLVNCEFSQYIQPWIPLLQYNVTLQGSFLCNKWGAFGHSLVKAENLVWYQDKKDIIAFCPINPVPAATSRILLSLLIRTKSSNSSKCLSYL